MKHTKWVLIKRDTGKLYRDRDDNPLVFNKRSDARALRTPELRIGQVNVVIKSDYHAIQSA